MNIHAMYHGSATRATTGASDSPEGGRTQRSLSTYASCVTCQARRIGCDGMRPTCGWCQGGEYDCIWASNGPPGEGQGESSSAASRKADRSRLACLPCRSRKTRCAGPPDGDTTRPCPRCDRLGIDCEWAKRKRPNQRVKEEQAADGGGMDERQSARSVSPSRTATDRRMSTRYSPASSSAAPPRISKAHALESLMANRTELNYLITQYFRSVHYFGFFSYVHEPSFFRLLGAGKAPRSLTAMMVVCTIQFTCEQSPANLDRADAIYEEHIRQLLDSAYSGFGVIELMALMLARLYEPCRGRFKAAWMMWGTAVRMMQYLSLHTFDETYPDAPSLRLNPLLKREALRRVAWSVFFQDTMYDSGHHGNHLVHESAFHLQLPCDEPTFMRGAEVTTAPLFPKTTVLSPWSSGLSVTPEGIGHVGLSAHLIRAAAMRRRVVHYRSLIRYSPDPAQKLLDELAGYEKELKQVINDFPPELAYTEDNLFVHSQARVAFVFLHLIRHNCFLMLAQTRLNVCARDDSLAGISVQFAKDRLRHALPCSKIFADVLRLDIPCDPSFAAHAYSSLEFILFDPLKISAVESTVDPKDPRYVEALKVLMDVIRKECIVNLKTRLLRIEACRRLLRCGFEDLVTQADKDACRHDVIRSKVDTEYDHRVFGIHQVEQRGKDGEQAKMASNDTWLHTGGVAPGTAPSRFVSPEIPGMDAGAEVRNIESQGVGSVDPLNAPNIPFIDDISTHLTGVDMPIVTPTTAVSAADVSQLDGNGNGGMANNGFWPPPMLDADARRWMNLDYSGFDMQPQTTGHEDTLFQDIDQTAFNDFSRFLEQAGTSNSDTELFPW